MMRMIARIFKLSGRYKSRISLAFFTVFIKGVFMNMPLFLGYFIFTEFYYGTPDQQLAVISLIAMVVSILIQIIFQHASDRLQSAAGFMLFADLRLKLGEHLRRMPMGFFTEGNIGRISSVLASDMSFVEEVSMSQIANMANYAFSELTMVLFMFYIDLRLGALSVFVVILMILAGSLSMKTLHRHSRARQDQIEDLSSAVIDYTEGMNIIKTYNLLGEKSKELSGSFERTRRGNVAFEMANVPASISIGVIYSLGVLATFLGSMHLHLQGELTAPLLIACILFGFQLYSPIRVFYDEATRLTVMNACLDRIEALFDGDELCDDGAATLPENTSVPEIAFEHVSFSYGKNEVLHDISFSAAKNTVTALVGPSGSGKSTIANLIARFWDVKEGSVKLRGIDIRELPLETVYDQISMVFQKVYLFQDTVYNNIAIGRPEATEAEVMEAAKKAHCFDFIMKLENGFQTIIGEGGASLSGGEKQRIAIARCILKDAPIVILDEATASVDMDNEREIQKAISALVENKTLIVIAHRLHTIKDANNIIVINNGEIEAQGTHEQLMCCAGTYAKFVSLRNSSTGWNQMKGA